VKQRQQLKLKVKARVKRKQRHQNLRLKKIKNLNKLYMENVISDIKVIEEDLENVEQKCEKVNCMAVYDAVMATFKLIYDLLFCCCKKKN
jgi:hypothetical protein